MACIRCFGDSNTYGFDPCSYLSGRYPAAIRWTNQLAAAAGRSVLNLGQNGRRIPLSPETVLPLFDPGDLLIVMLGSNDLLMGLSAEETTERMERLLSAAIPHCKQLLLIAPPPLKAGAWVTDPAQIAASSLLAARYQALADRLGVFFADAGSWNIELAYDGVHFSESGHRTFSAELKRTLETLHI